MDADSNSSDCDFSLLPPHVIAHIFQYLNFRQRLNSARTCKSWYFGSCDPIIWRNTTVRIMGKTNRLEQFHRPFGTLVLNRVNFDTFHNYKEFFAKFGQYIREIYFDYCNLSLQQLVDCLICLSNLNTLKLYVTDSGPIFTSEINLSVSYMEMIKTNLKSMRECVLALPVPAKGLLHYIISCMPNIKTLHIANCEYNDDLVYNSIFDYFNMFPQEVNLTCLQLSSLYSSATTEFMASFAEITQKLNIAKVILGSIDSNTFRVEYYHKNFEIFCKKLSNVRALTIRSPGEKQLVDICRYMTKLTELNLISLNHQNLQSVGYLNHLGKLTLQFDYISYSEFISENVLLELFSRLGNLTELDINHSITQRTIEGLCLNCKRLTRLVLSRLYTKNFGLIFKHLTNLEYLNLWFWSSEKAHLDCDITNLRKLKELQISGFAPGMTYELIEQLPHLKPSCMEYIKNHFKPGYVAPEYETTLNMLADLFDQ